VTSSGEQRPLSIPSLAVHAGDGVLLVGVRAVPSASRTELRGLYGDRLKVAVNAPPEAGKANARLVQALSEWLGVRTEQIEVRSGRSGRDKVVAFSGIMEQELRDKLERLLPDGERPG